MELRHLQCMPDSWKRRGDYVQNVDTPSQKWDMIILNVSRIMLLTSSWYEETLFTIPGTSVIKYA